MRSRRDAIVARNLELLDDRPLGLVVLDRLIVGRAFAARAQQVGFAHVERIEAALARDRVHHPLDGDHALRAAEAAKGGVGDGVGLEAARDDRDVGQPVAVAGVEHRAVADSGRQVRGAAAARVERHVVTGDDALIVVSHPPIRAEIVALAGQHEIVVAIEPDLARMACHPRGERSDRGPGAGLALLAAEAAAHPARFDRDEGVRDPENARDDVLRLRRVLRRSVHRHLVAFAGKGERRLAFEIEMLLSADCELTLKPARGFVDRGGRVATPEGVIVLHARAGHERVGNGDRRPLRLDVDLGETRRPAGLVACAGDDGEQRLAVEHHVLVSEQRLVGEHRRDVVLAGNIGRRQNGDDARRRARRLEVQALQSAAGLVGHADRDMQRARGLADIVDIVRRALNVQTRGIVRQRLMDDGGRESETGVVIRRHGAFQSGSARLRRRFR